MAKKYISNSDNYSIIDFLGSGAYGAVFAAKCNDTKQLFAVKSCKDILSSRTLAKRTLREMRILRYCEHPNVVKLTHLIPPKDADLISELNMVFELMDTDLAQVIRSPQILLVEHIQYFAVQLVSALDYLHRSRVIHRDVKPRNILVNADCTLKLADFGLAKIFQDEIDSTSTSITDYVTTRWYRAPEILAGWTAYGASIDMWAVGCIIAELFQRVPLFPGGDSVKQVELIVGTLGLPDAKFMAHCKRSSRKHMMRMAEIAPMRSNLKHKFGRIPHDAVDLLSKLLLLDPTQRLSAADCFEHRFLACTRYPRYDENKHLQIPSNAFLHETGEITIECIQVEIIVEVRHYNPSWMSVNDDLGSAMASDDITVLDNLYPELNVSSDIEDDEGDELHRIISEDVLDTFSPPLLQRRTSSEQTDLLESSVSQPSLMLSKSLDSVSADDQISRDVLKPDIICNRKERNMSKDTVIDGFFPPSVEEFGNGIMKVNATEEQFPVELRPDIVKTDMQAFSSEYDLKTLKSSEGIVTINGLNSHTPVPADASDCKASLLLSFGFCANAIDVMNIGAVEPDIMIASSTDPIENSKNPQKYSFQRTEESKQLRYDQKQSSCVIS